MSAANLLRRICAEPQNVDARLILCDYLEDRGEEPERCEFIRLQIELSRWGETPRAHGNWHVDCRNNAAGTDEKCNAPPTRQGRKPCEYHRLRGRERDLLQANFGAWTDCLPEELVTKQCPRCEDYVADWHTNVIECRHCECTGLVCDQDNVEFRRGFCEQVTTTLPIWLAHGPQIVAATPITFVGITDKRSVIGHYSHEHWAWFKYVEDGVDHDVIPAPLWDVLPNGVDFEIVDDGVKLYTSEQAANEALSAAALLLARTEAGLNA